MEISLEPFFHILPSMSSHISTLQQQHPEVLQLLGRNAKGGGGTELLGPRVHLLLVQEPAMAMAKEGARLGTTPIPESLGPNRLGQRQVWVGWECPVGGMGWSSQGLQGNP